MRIENTRMKEFLASHGIKATPRYLHKGSMKGTWGLYDRGTKWTPELTEQLNALGFVDYDHTPLDQYSGNGGLFQVFVRGHNEMLAA